MVLTVLELRTRAGERTLGFEAVEFKHIALVENDAPSINRFTFNRALGMQGMNTGASEALYHA